MTFLGNSCYNAWSIYYKYNHRYYPTSINLGILVFVAWGFMHGQAKIFSTKKISTSLDPKEYV